MRSDSVAQAEANNGSFVPNRLTLGRGEARAQLDVERPLYGKKHGEAAGQLLTLSLKQQLPGHHHVPDLIGTLVHLSVRLPASDAPDLLLDRVRFGTARFTQVRPWR
jgi:hypothetical protein